MEVNISPTSITSLVTLATISTMLAYTRALHGQNRRNNIQGVLIWADKPLPEIKTLVTTFCLNLKSDRL